MLAVSGVSNLRVAPAFGARDLLADSGGPDTVGEVRAALGINSSRGIDPDQILDMAELAGYRAQLCPAARADCIEVLFRRDSVDTDVVWPGYRAGAVADFAND